MAPRTPILEVRALRKSFGGTEVLKGIDLAVEPQELVFIIGPSGSGKSTFLRCLNRLEEPTGGSIIVDGVDLLDPKTDINAMRRRIGMVFQAFNLYPHMTALGNVTLALRKVMRLAARAGRRGRARGARPRRARGQGARLSERALRRPAAARRHRPRHRAGAEDHAVRRADLGARSRARRQRARGDARPRRLRHDHGGGEPRDALCPRSRRTASSSWRTAASATRAAGPIFGPEANPRARAFLSGSQDDA